MLAYDAWISSQSMVPTAYKTKLLLHPCQWND